MPSRTDLAREETARESTARDTCRIFAAAYEPPSRLGLLLYEVASLGAAVAVVAFIVLVVAR